MSEYIAFNPSDEQKEFWFPYLDHVDPNDLVAMYGPFDDALFESGVDDDDPFLVFDQAYHVAFDVVITDYLEALPARNIGRSLKLYELFAGSERVRNRIDLAIVGLQALTKVDHDAGLDLWQRLIRDPDADVRDEAHLKLHLHSDPAATEHGPESFGLTRLEAHQLRAQYNRAERGENLHDPVKYAGELALRRLCDRFDLG